MKYKQNLHTHTCYCDGADTPEEILLTALEKKFDSIGFSGHSSMAPEIVKEYKSEILRLKEKYASKIKVFCGLEFDYISDASLEGYDYTIGTVHFFNFDGVVVPFDRPAEVVKDAIDTHFGGDGMKFAKAYFEKLSTLPQRGNFDILGHFDIIAKNHERVEFFDENSKEYLDAAFGAIYSLKGKIPLFEVNTGAISRGYRTTPYPAVPLIKEFRRQGYGVVITSDCHAKDTLDCHFAEAEELLKHCGFKGHYILTNQGFKEVSF